MANDIVQPRSAHRFYKIYTSICLTLILLLLIVMTATLIYAALKIDRAANNLDHELQSINTSLSKYSSGTSGSSSTPSLSPSAAQYLKSIGL